MVGFKNAGKTTLTERLLAGFVARGLVVRTIKHAHHALDLDTVGRDSWRRARRARRRCQSCCARSEHVAGVVWASAGPAVP